MTLRATLIGILIAAAFIVMVLFVLFGQITVRKLRKNPETKHELGLEVMGGWDILNVAQALSLPKRITQRIKKSRLSFLEADAEVLYQHTTIFDRCLARAFYWLWVASGSAMILLVVLNSLGVFD